LPTLCSLQNVLHKVSTVIGRATGIPLSQMHLDDVYAVSSNPSRLYLLFLTYE
jgi:hypothetical protein